MATTTFTVTYTREDLPATATFRYTATTTVTVTGWGGSESLSAYGDTKTEARDNLRKLVQLAVATNGISDQFDVTT